MLQLLIAPNAFAQITGPEQDCINAIPVCKAVYFQRESYKGFGSISEINHKYSCMAEYNSVWYMFSISRPGDLEFSIIPYQSWDDYDFALFNLTGHACDEIFNNDSMEVRCNFSHPDVSATTETGLKYGYDNDKESAAGPSFCRPLSVEAGETYVLMISNFSTTNYGYTLNLSLGSADINDVPPPEISFDGISADSMSILVRFSHPVFCNSIAPEGKNFSVSGGVPVTVTGASPDDNPPGAYTQSVKISFSSPLRAGFYTVLFTPNTKHHTVMDFCGSIPLPDAISFTVKNIWEIKGYEVR